MSTTLYRALASVFFLAAHLAPAQPVLTSIDAVRELPPATAAGKLPVKIEAVATYVDYSNGGIFIHDGTNGIYLAVPLPLQSEFDLHTGDRLRISAVTGPGEYIPALSCNSLAVEGQSALPSPTQVTPQNLFSPGLDCQWVQVTGVIVSAERSDRDQFVFTLELYGWNLKILLPPGEADISAATAYMQQRVTFQGVSATVYNRQRQMTGRYFLVPSLKHIQVLSEQTATGSPVRLTVDQLLLSDTASESIVRVTGTVTAGTKNELYLRGEGGGLRVLMSSSQSFRPGDQVEVLGFATIAPFRPVLRAREVVKLNSGEVPEPVDLMRLLDNLPSLQAELVTVPAAVFLGSQDNPDGIILHCRVQERFFEAILPRPMILPPNLKPGSTMNLVGICELTTTHPLPRSEWVDGFRIHLRTPGDLVVASNPSWWTPQRLLLALSAATGLGLVALFWGWQLRRRVAAQTRVISTQIEREATLNERQRIARDLHDTLEQELTGISLQLGNVEERFTATPERALLSLRFARQMLRYCREEARTSIRDLRSNLLEQRGLVGAMQESLPPLAADSPTGLVLQVQGSPVRLGESIETHLLRIAQEAVANAVHHAAATEIQVRLQYADEAVTLVVQDDGRGFDAVAEPPRGHFGLVGMQERANKMGAEIFVKSAPGQGTAIRVVVKQRSGNGGNIS